MRFSERALQRVRHEAAQLLHGDVLILHRVHQMAGEITRAAALRADEDHRETLPAAWWNASEGLGSVSFPSACISRLRMMVTS